MVENIAVVFLQVWNKLKIDFFFKLQYAALIDYLMSGVYLMYSMEDRETIAAEQVISFILTFSENLLKISFFDIFLILSDFS